MAVSDTNKVKEILQRIEALKSMYVKVGILSSESGEILMIANVHEFGKEIEVTDKMRGFFLYKFGVGLKKDTRVIKIPERSFIRSSFDARQDKIGEHGDKLIEMVLNGDLEVRSFYEMLGQTASDAIKDYLINNVVAPPDTELTVRNKHGKSNPLVNTGRLVNSIDYEIVGG